MLFCCEAAVLLAGVVFRYCRGGASGSPPGRCVCGCDAAVESSVVLRGAPACWCALL